MISAQHRRKIDRKLVSMNKTTLFLIALSAFLVFVITTTPASLVYSSFQEKISDGALGLAISQVEGSIWQGQGDFHFRQFPVITGDWQLSPLHLLAATARSSITLKADGLNGVFDFSLTPRGGSINNLNAVVQDSYLNEITTSYGLDLSGEVQLEQANLSFNQSRLTALEGELHWSGGIVHIQTPEKIHTVNLPALDGRLSLEDANFKLDIKESGNSLLQIHIRPDGWAQVAINYAFMDLANLPLPANASAGDDPAVVLEEKIL